MFSLTRRAQSLCEDGTRRDVVNLSYERVKLVSGVASPPFCIEEL